jgi:hypothetical protein
VYCETGIEVGLVVQKYSPTTHKQLNFQFTEEVLLLFVHAFAMERLWARSERGKNVHVTPNV